MLQGKKIVYCWGAGRLGVIFSRFIQYFIHIEIEGFIDNNPEKQKKCINGKNVYPFSRVLQEKDNVYIIICTNQHNFEIKKELTEYGWKYGENFCVHKDIFKTIYEKDGIFLQSYVECYITNRCNLKCKHCGLFIPYAKHNKDRELQDILDDIDLYFSVVDKVMEFRLLGGEPFLFRNIATLIDYINDKYKNSIGILKVVTNGTVIPTKRVLESIKRIDGEVDISDYSSTVPIATKQRKRLIDTLNNGNVNYQIMKMDQWFKIFDYPLEVKTDDRGGLCSLFKSCDYGCRTIYEKKFFYCSIDCAAQRNGYIKGTQGDYVTLNEDVKTIRGKILELDRGNVDKGYVSFCKYCYGGMSINSRVIPVAEQL